MILALIIDPNPNRDRNPNPTPDPNPDPTPDPTPDPGQVRMDRGAFTRLLGPLDSLLELRRYTATGEEVAAPEGGGEAGGEAGGEGGGEDGGGGGDGEGGGEGGAGKGKKEKEQLLTMQRAARLLQHMAMSLRALTSTNPRPEQVRLGLG